MTEAGVVPSTITEPVRIELQKLAYHLIGRMGRPLPEILWHYTTFDGLRGILKSKSIWTTQHSCLNDSLEYLHLPRLIHDEVKRRLPLQTDIAMKSFYAMADRDLAQVDTAAMGHFVACFSEDKDDLGQWRGYGGGTCGYAIGFNAAAIHKAAERRPLTYLLPLQYAAEEHDYQTKLITDWAETQYRTGLARVGIAYELWGQELQAELAQALDLAIAMVKHPKFKFENERRIATKLLDGEHTALEFRQKQTLLARHLPVSLLSADDPDALLPIECVMVGPGPAQKVTQIAIGDLLRKNGYSPDLVEPSVVPYRVP